MKQINRKKVVSLSLLVLLIIGVVCGVVLYQYASKHPEELELEEFVFDEESGMDDAAPKSNTSVEETVKQSQQVSVKEESGYSESMADQGSVPQEGADNTQSSRIDADDSKPSAVSSATDTPSQQFHKTTTAMDEKNPNEMAEIPISANAQ